MTEDCPIQQKIWNIYDVVDEIKETPQTYKTILQHEHKNGTYQVILRRKLNKLIKQGVVCKTNIPGTRFGKCIYYIVPKEYNIVVEGTRTGSEVYYFFKYEPFGSKNSYIKLKEYWQLVDGEWKKCEEEKDLFEGHILKWV
jgi:hypothetical protein